MHVVGGLSVLALLGQTVAQDLSSCCAVLNIESTAEASEHQSNRLGQYRLGGLFSDRPIYKHEEREEFLFYLTSRNRGLWMVGPSVGQFNGGLANRGDPVCAEDTPTGQWKYTDGQSWHRDSSLKITCVEQELPECVYNDQTDFEGGDLPEALGGGGLVTSATSSAECITECETRKACRYWTWTGESGANCYLKTDRLSQVRRPKHVSGSVSTACAQPKPAEKAEPKFNEQEINGKFKITSLKWDDKLSDPSSIEYKELSNSIEDSLVSMLKNEGDLSEQVEDFTVEVQRFTRGSVVCDFKVNYVLKEAYVAIPFAIKPSNITDAMGKNFKFKKGILFQRFLIAADSFKTSAPVDHCAAKGCSHKCNYDYGLEDYVCTCPPSLVLDIAQRNCLSPEEAEAEKATTAAPEATTAAAEEVTTPETLVEDVEQEAVEDEPVDAEESVDATTKATEEVEEDIAPGVDAEKVETTTAVALDDDLDEETSTTVKVPADYEDFGADVDDKVVDGSSTASPEDESTEASEEETVPQFGDKETTVSPAAEEEASGDSESSDVDNTDEEATTEEEIRPIESSTPADDDDTSEQGDEDVAIESSGEDEEELGTTSFPDIMKILPEVIDEAINDLFDGATTDSDDTEGEDITADPVVITVDDETTTEADDVTFSTTGPIQPLEDPSLSEDVEDAEATTVSIQEFTEETPADPESRDQEAAATDAPLADDATTSKEEASPEKMPRLDASNEITTTEGGQPEMTTVAASDGETEDKSTTTQPSSETETEPAPMEGDEAITELDGGLVTVTPGTDSEDTSVSSEDVDVDAPKDEVTTVSPTTVTVLSIEETDEGVTIVTTMRPAEDTITTAKPADDAEETTGSQDIDGTTLKAGSDTTTQATGIDADDAEDQTTQKSEVTTVMTDSESDTITITVGSEADSEATTPKTDMDSTTPKSEVDTTDLPEDAGVRTGVEVTNPAEEGETTTTKTDAEIDSDDEDADNMTDKDEVTTPKTDVDEEDVDGEGRSMLEESSTTLPGDEEITTPRSESESTVPSVSQDGSTKTPETEVTALPIDEDVEMTTLSQSPPSLGPSSEEPEGSGVSDTEVTISPVDADTPSDVLEDGTVTTIMPDAVVTLLTTVRPTMQKEAQTEQPEDGEDKTAAGEDTSEDGEDTTGASSAEEEKSPESGTEEGTTLAPEDGGMHEFDCSEFTDAELAFADPNQIPLECRLRPKEGGEPKTVYILIPKEGLDLTRLFDKNVKVVVKDLMIMDISPK